MSSLQRFFYYSRTTSLAHVRGVADIAQVARSFTKDHGFSGLLVLDGEHFCEYLEGPAAAMQSLITRLKTDPRHSDMVVLLDDALPGERLFVEWNMAFMLKQAQAQSLQSLSQLDGEEALAYFMAWVPALDVVP